MSFSILKRIRGRYKWFSRNISLIFNHNTAGIYSNFFSLPKIPNKKLITNWRPYLNDRNLRFWIDKIYKPIITNEILDSEKGLLVPDIQSLKHTSVEKGYRVHFFTENINYCNFISKYLFDNMAFKLFKPFKFYAWRLDFWRNFPYEGDSEFYSNYWHYDRYGCNVFSVFINLDETTTLHGPFHYMSYEDSKRESSFMRPFVMEDHRISPLKLKTNPKVLKHIGKFNALGICNDRILHRASKVKKEQRDMLRVCFRLKH